MKVEVVTPEDYTGTVIGDLNSRRGHIHISNLDEVRRGVFPGPEHAYSIDEDELERFRTAISQEM